MKRFFFLTLLAVCFSTFISAQYQPDYLGDGYMQRTFNMPDDYEGKVVCTLVRKNLDTTTNKAILYIHGYNDYFFQKQLGDSAAAHGYNFYALDLRKYGRSILANQDTFAVRNLNEYFADIDTSLYTMKKEGQKEIILMAHSTGGLTTPLYLASKGENLAVSALILNSPFLDMNKNSLMENIIIPAVSFIGHYLPNIPVDGHSLSMYAESLLKQYHGEWDYNTDWKLTYGHPIRSGWIHAIHSGQQKLQKGLSLNLPILVLSSNKSIKETSTWNDAYMSADIVLDVNDIQKYGATLGKNVTRIQIDGGIHDLLLSPIDARKETYATLFNWLEQNLP